MRDLDDMTGAIVDAAITISMDLGHGHPPDLQDAAVQTVLQQGELLCAEWV